MAKLTAKTLRARIDQLITAGNFSEASQLTFDNISLLGDDVCIDIDQRIKDARQSIAGQEETAIHDAKVRQEQVEACPPLQLDSVENYIGRIMGLDPYTGLSLQITISNMLGYAGIGALRRAYRAQQTLQGRFDDTEYHESLEAFGESTTGSDDLADEQRYEQGFNNPLHLLDAETAVAAYKHSRMLANTDFARLRNQFNLAKERGPMDPAAILLQLQDGIGREEKLQEEDTKLIAGELSRHNIDMSVPTPITPTEANRRKVEREYIGSQFKDIQSATLDAVWDMTPLWYQAKLWNTAYKTLRQAATRASQRMVRYSGTAEQRERDFLKLAMPLLDEGQAMLTLALSSAEVQQAVEEDRLRLA